MQSHSIGKQKFYNPHQMQWNIAETAAAALLALAVRPRKSALFVNYLVGSPDIGALSALSLFQASSVLLEPSITRDQREHLFLL
jgi:hypothetical protein